MDLYFQHFQNSQAELPKFQDEYWEISTPTAESTSVETSGLK